MREFQFSHNGRGIIRVLPQPTDESEKLLWKSRKPLEGDPMTRRREIEKQIREQEKKTPPEVVALTSSRPRGAASDDDANPNHLEDFTRLVDVAARTRPKT